jgi:predicted dehydrogenase
MVVPPFESFHNRVMKKGILVGFGFMGGMHAQIYKRLPEAEIVAVVDPDTATALAKLKELGMDAAHFETLSEALQSADADFVDICLPTFLHLAAAREAIAAGKAVFCEKPLATDSAEAEVVVLEADSAGITFMVGHCIRFWPEYVALRRLVESGDAGNLLSLTLQRRASRPGYSKDNWLQDPAKSCGAALDLHIHDTDFVLSLLGAPTAVTSTGVSDLGGVSHIFTQYHYDSGPVVLAEGGWNYPPKWGFLMAFQAVFENGTMEYDSNASPTTRIVIGDGEPTEATLDKADAGASELAEGNLSDLGGYYFELSHFIGCLENGTKPETSTGQDALASLKTTFAEIKSVESGKPQSM